jgi:hypothetical protein
MLKGKETWEGRRKIVYRILGHLVIVRKHGMINRLCHDSSSTVFINQQVKNAKLSILHFNPDFGPQNFAALFFPSSNPNE